MGDKMFQSSFEKFLPFDEFLDFTFVVAGKPFKVHRIVFAGKKEKFRVHRIMIYGLVSIFLINSLKIFKMSS
jgi:hypothetical protein